MVSDNAPAPQPPAAAPQPPAAPALPPVAVPAPDFAAVSKLIDDAIAAHKLPGAVVMIGHGGKVVFHQAYGSRKLAGEPGLDGSPAPAEPMTEDTIFDVASLTKPLATAPAVMQLYEQGKVALDDPVQNYLPDFNTANDPQRAKVTVRMLLTHTSGETGDVNLGDPWGLEAADKAEGIHRALTTPLESAPGERFRYSDINFILLGALIEKVTGEAEDGYVQQQRIRPPRHGRHPVSAAGRRLRSAHDEGRRDCLGSRAAAPVDCPAGTWNTSLLSRIAPTARDEEGRADPSKNPDLDYLLRGTVHDTTARRMGGVAGHAGVFSTAHDVSTYAQALLDRLAGRPSNFPLQQATLELMTTPQQPGHTAEQLDAANDAARATRPNTQTRCSPRTIRRSRDRACAAWAGISTRDCPSRAAWSSPSVASATPASPEPRCGSTPARIPTSCCSRIPSKCEAVRRSRSCGVTWRRRRRRPCICTAVVDSGLQTAPSR